MAKKPETITTNYLIIETAMVVYQILEDTRLAVNVTLPEDHPLKARQLSMPEWCDNFGSATIRDQSWQIAPIIEECWRGMTEEERDGDITWDWEFVPDVLLHCFNFNPKSEYLKPVSNRVDEIIKAYRDGVAAATAFKSELPASTHARDVFIRDCKREAVKQWAYEDLVTDDCLSRNNYSGSRMQQAFEMGEKPAEFVKWLGEKLDLTPASSWL